MIVITPLALTPLITALTPILDAFLFVRNVVGVVGILYAAYLVLWAIPELPRYIRMRMM